MSGPLHGLLVKFNVCVFTFFFQVQKTLPSLPIIYWNKNKNRPMYYKNESCARFPSIYELEFNNIYWQTLVTSNGTFQVCIDLL